MKKSFIFASILILLTGMISAYSFNAGSVFETVFTGLGDDLFLGGVFLISFGFIYWALNRTAFKENTALSAIIAGVISLWITYALYTQGITWDIPNLLSEFGFSDFAIDLMIFFATAIVLLFAIFKLKSAALLLAGVLILGFYLWKGLPLEIALVGGALIIAWILIKYIPFRAKSQIYGMKNKYNINIKGLKNP